MATQKILNIYKPIGLTSFQLVEAVKTHYPELQEVKVGYAGRLDPLAHGVMLLMVGEECKKRDYYQALSKEYEFKLLLGVKTDTYDFLGKILSFNEVKEDYSKQLKELILNEVGESEQQYPPYSSYNIDGKSLFQWSREGKIDQIKIPSKKIKIESFDYLGNEDLSKDKIHDEIVSRINLVTGDFRQLEIKEEWRIRLKKSFTQSFTLYSFRIATSSGAYIRSIANKLGESIATGAIAYEIKRTRVGEFKLSKSQRL